MIFVYWLCIWKLFLLVEAVALEIRIVYLGNHVIYKYRQFSFFLTDLHAFYLSFITLFHFLEPPVYVTYMECYCYWSSGGKVQYFTITYGLSWIFRWLFVEWINFHLFIFWIMNVSWIDKHRIFLPYSVNILYYIGCFSNVKLTLYSRDKVDHDIFSF